MTQVEMFEQIWKERPHFSEVSGDYLGDEPNAFFFAHVISKGSHPNFYLLKSNVMLMTQEEHIAYDNGTSDKKLKGLINAAVSHKRAILKQVYNTIQQDVLYRLKFDWHNKKK